MELLYDTIYFLYRYFNDNKEQQDNESNHVGDYIYFIKLKEKVNPIPDYLSPFFFGVDFDNSIWMNICAKLESFSKDGLLEYIKKDEDLCGRLIKFIFPLISEFDCLILRNEDSSTYAIHMTYQKLFKQQDISETMISSFVLVSTSFDQVKEDLVSVIKSVYDELANLRESLSSVISSVLNSGKNNKDLFNFLSLNNFKPDNLTQYCISLIDPYAIDVKWQKNTVFLGINYTERFDNETFGNVNIIGFCKIMSAEVSLTMFNLLLSNGQLCAEDIEKETGYGITYIYKHCAEFSRQQIIYCSKCEGKVKYYKLNKKYIGYLIKSLNKVIQ